MPYSQTTSSELLSVSTLVEMLHRSRASIYRDIQRGEFPRPLKLGSSSRWRRSEIEAYIERLAGDRKQI